MQTITKHYINGTFVESHGSELMDLVIPTTAQVIGHVTPAMRRMRGEPLRRLSARSQPSAGARRESDLRFLRRLHEVVSARIDDIRSWWADLENGKPLPIAVPASLKD